MVTKIYSNLMEMVVIVLMMLPVIQRTVMKLMELFKLSCQMELKFVPEHY